MAIPIIHTWENYFRDPHEGLGSSYERIVLNDILEGIRTRYQVQSALESPSFGFTGISGINLVRIAQLGVRVHLQDHDAQRLGMIRALWEEQATPLESSFNQDYRTFAFDDGAFDMSFSFSALWFTRDLAAYLKELARVTRKVIFISVPNRDGIGYRMQLKDYTPQRYPELALSHIDPASIQHLLGRQGWKLRESGYFDCPPWPDIGMSKEDFAGKLLGRKKQDLPAAGQPAHPNPVSILAYYRGDDPRFPQRMRRFNHLETHAPVCFKRVWAHHFYMVYTPGSNGS